MSTIKKQCTRCKNNLDIEEFKQKRDKSYQKMCILCLEKNKKYKKKCEHGRERSQCKVCCGASICEHNRIRSKCKDCGGASICEHNRERNKCKDCGGNSICEHNKLRNQCKECMNDEEKINYIQKIMISRSRQTDKKCDRYDADNFIDKCFLEGLFEDSTNCAYCKIDFTYNERCDTLVTIERVNNDIGHIKSNCILACFKCNCSKVGQKN